MKCTMSKKQLEEAAARLAEVVVWALKYMKTERGGLVTKIEKGKVEMKTFDDFACDALDLVGYKLDRKALADQRMGKGRAAQRAAKLLGRRGGLKGGRSNSEAKVVAARRNGVRGGRPKRAA